MDKKLLDQSYLTPPDQDFDPRDDRGRSVTLPQDAGLKALENLTLQEIEAKLKTQGAAIAYAGLLKLAAGHGTTPPGTQYNACAFLLARAAELLQTDKDKGTAAERLKDLSDDKLQQILDIANKMAQAPAEPSTAAH